MRRRLPSLGALRAFEAAARHLSFSAAAEELGVTHGAVSHQVKTLEADLGVKLFRRLNRRVVLSEAGAGLLPGTRAAFDLLDTSVAQVAAPRRPGTLVVACPATFAMQWLIPRLHRFQAKHPKLDIRVSASDAAIDFARSDVDVAIRIGTPPWGEDVEATSLIDERAGPVCSPAYARETRLRGPEDLCRARLLHTETRPLAWPDWLKRAELTGMNGRAGQRFEHFYFLLHAAMAGLGVAIGPHVLVAEDLASGRLVAPFGFMPSGKTYALVHPPATAGRPFIQLFRRWILAESRRKA